MRTEKKIKCTLYTVGTWVKCNVGFSIWGLVRKVAVVGTVENLHWCLGALERPTRVSGLKLLGFSGHTLFEIKAPVVSDSMWRAALCTCFVTSTVDTSNT